MCGLALNCISVLLKAFMELTYGNLAADLHS